jgi:hypothetical protein
MQVEDLVQLQTQKRAVRLSRVQAKSKELEQTKIVTTSDYDIKTGLQKATDAAGNEYRFRALKGSGAPEIVSIILDSSSQVAAGDWL